MVVGIAVDHAGFPLKHPVKEMLEHWGYQIRDFGANNRIENDDYPDYVVPMGIALIGKKIERGIAVCGSGVGACITANKIKGVRAALVTDIYSAHQGVEDDCMNIICIGARVVGDALALELIHAFLSASFRHEERYIRRLSKIQSLEEQP